MGALRQVVLFYLCATIALSDLPESTFGWQFDITKYHMHIVNGFTGGQQLHVHCSSKDDDLGPHVLNPGMETSWAFRINFTGTTEFTCEWRSDNQHVTCPVFWKESTSEWLRIRCAYKDCYWIAKDDGIYLRNIPAGIDEKVHPWE